MKRLKYILFLAVSALILGSCEPTVLPTPDIGATPSAADLQITITPGADAFHFVIENKSTITGIATWDLGNGNTASGEKAEAYYPVPDTYTITLTLYTKGGNASITKSITTTETDWAYFSDPVITLLCGGIEAVNGRSWVMDSLATGHMGVGPNLANSTTWWSAGPLAKSNKGLYDDALNFKLTGFAATYDNKGVSYVKDFRRTDAAYSNPRINDTDYMVDYPGPISGTWSFSTKDGKKYLKLSGPKPIFPCFDTGAKDGEYEILNITENSLELACIGGDGNAWHYLLIPLGYVLPTITFDAVFAPTANPNEYEFSLANLKIPAGLSVTKVAWNFGDGNSVETTNANQSQVNTFMRKGTYIVSVELSSSEGKTYTKDLTVVVAVNHPDYVEYLLNAMVMYNDFGETMLTAAGLDLAGGTATLDVVANPDAAKYPNRSKNVALFTKTNNDWANVFIQLPDGYRFDITKQTKFKVLVYGTAGQEVLMKLENTDKGGNAWQTGSELKQKISATNTWEIMEFDYSGAAAGWDWTGDIFTTNIAIDDRFNHGFYNVVRIMYQPGVHDATYSVYLDDIAGPHVAGLK
ncbi:MAG: PKD domain-containing protein [Bacteroidales bacterium]